MFIRGGSPPPPEVQPLTLLYTISHEKGTPLYTFYWQMEPLSHTLYLVCDFASLLTAVNALSFKWNQSQK